MKTSVQAGPAGVPARGPFGAAVAVHRGGDGSDSVPLKGPYFGGTRELVEHHERFARLISHRVPFAEAERAFEPALTPGGAEKVVVAFDEPPGDLRSSGLLPAGPEQTDARSQRDHTHAHCGQHGLRPVGDEGRGRSDEQVEKEQEPQQGSRREQRRHGWFPPDREDLDLG